MNRKHLWDFLICWRWTLALCGCCSASPTNIDEEAFFIQDQHIDPLCNFRQAVHSAILPCSQPATSIAASKVVIEFPIIFWSALNFRYLLVAKEFQESKLSEIKALISNKVILHCASSESFVFILFWCMQVQVVLVTTCKWDYVPLMYEGLHFIYEGRLVDIQLDGQTRNFTMRLDYLHRKSPICVQACQAQSKIRCSERKLIIIFWWVSVHKQRRC